MRATVVAVAATAALAVGACGDSRGDGLTVSTLPSPPEQQTSSPPDPSGSGSSAVTAPRGPRIDPAVFDVAARSITDGSLVDLGDLVGRDVLVWFWSPW